MFPKTLSYNAAEWTHIWFETWLDHSSLIGLMSVPLGLNLVKLTYLIDLTNHGTNLFFLREDQ